MKPNHGQVHLSVFLPLPLMTLMINLSKIWIPSLISNEESICTLVWVFIYSPTSLLLNNLNQSGRWWHFLPRRPPSSFQEIKSASVSIHFLIWIFPNVASTSYNLTVSKHAPHCTTLLYFSSHSSCIYHRIYRFYCFSYICHTSPNLFHYLLLYPRSIQLDP